MSAAKSRRHDYFAVIPAKAGFQLVDIEEQELDSSFRWNNERIRMIRAWLSLGSNVEPEANLRAALRELRGHFGNIVVSPAYRFPAVGFDGPDFLNLAVGIETDVGVAVLNDWLHALENRHGRRRDVPRFSSRTLDVDIILFGDKILKGPGNLEIPRPELKYAFVLKPLADIAPDVMHPVLGKTIGQLWREFPAEKDHSERVADL